MRTMLRLLPVVLGLPSLCSAPRSYSVEFTVLNRWGRFHNYKVLHFRSASGLDFASRFRGLAVLDIPHGSYDYELEPAPGDFSTQRLSGTISVYRPQVHVTRVLSTTDTLGDIGSLGVTGMVESLPVAPGPVWIIVQNVYGEYREESAVDAQGKFEFEQVFGNNVLTVCAGSDVLMYRLP